MTELLRLCSDWPFTVEVPCATAGTGTAGIMFGRPFIGDTEDDFAWFEVGADEPAATTGGFDPVATTGVDDSFFTAPAAEA